MAAFFLFVIVATALGIAGAVASGVAYLLALGVAVFVVDLLVGGLVIRARRKKPAR